LTLLTNLNVTTVHEKDILMVEMLSKYSDTPANEDNSFRNHIR